MSDILNNKNPIQPKYLENWPPKKTLPSATARKMNAFDEIVAAKKEAVKKARDYRTRIKSGLPAEETIECFQFFCKYQDDFDKQGKLRTQLVKKMDDLTLVFALGDMRKPWPLFLSRLVERRLRPRDPSKGNSNLESKTE